MNSLIHTFNPWVGGWWAGERYVCQLFEMPTLKINAFSVTQYVPHYVAGWSSFVLARQLPIESMLGCLQEHELRVAVEMGTILCSH